MKYQTSEIERFLKLTSERPVRRSDIIFAKEHRGSSDARTELVNVRPTIIDQLVERGIIEETYEGCKLTAYGSSIQELLAKYKKSSTNVELVPVRTESLPGKVTYGIRHKSYSEFKIEIPSVTASKNGAGKIQNQELIKMESKTPLLTGEPQEYRGIVTEVEKVFNELKIDKSLKSLNKSADSLDIKTKLPFYRTKEDVERLKRIAGEIGMGMSQTSLNENLRQYNFSFQGRTPITLISKKSGRGARSYKPIEIKVDTKQSTESTSEKVKTLIERL